MSKQCSQPDFDGVARLYRWAEYLLLGNLLRSTRESFLPDVLHCRRALLLGDGDGRFAAKLLRASPSVRVDAVDTSARMLQLLAHRCARNGNATRLRFWQGSALKAEVTRTHDLIVTHFFLDCLTSHEVVQLARKLVPQSAESTLWLVSDFGMPSHPLLRPLAQAYVRLLYLAFRLLTGLRVHRLPDIPLALGSAGWTRIARKERLGGFLYSELWCPPPIQAQAGSLEPDVADATSPTGRTSTQG